MNRFSGLENDISYLEYVEFKKRIINLIDNDDKDLDSKYISMMVDILQDRKKTLDKIKEYRDGEDRNIITEVGESN